MGTDIVLLAVIDVGEMVVAGTLANDEGASEVTLDMFLEEALGDLHIVLTLLKHEGLGYFYYLD